MNSHLLKIAIITSLLIICLCKSFCYAANWLEIRKGSRGDTFYLDLSNIERSGDIVSFWYKMIPDKELKYTHINVDMFKFYCRMDCNAKVFTNLEKIIYYRGKYLSRDYAHGNLENADLEYEIIPPDSIADTFYKAVCKNQLPVDNFSQY